MIMMYADLEQENYEEEAYVATKRVVSVAHDVNGSFDSCGG